MMVRGMEGISTSRSEEAGGGDILLDVVRKLGDAVASVAQFLGMTTSPVNWITRLEEITELAR